MQVVYRLRDDVSVLATFQRKAQEKPSASDLKYGLRGSSEWWQSIDSGALQTQTVRGVVRGLWLGQWFCGPAVFDMELADGSLFGGLCYLEPEEASELFNLGQFAEVDMVTEEGDTLDGEIRQVQVWLELRLGEISPNPVMPLPHSEENFGRFSRMRKESESVAASKPYPSGQLVQSPQSNTNTNGWLEPLRLKLAQWFKADQD